MRLDLAFILPAAILWGGAVVVWGAGRALRRDPRAWPAIGAALAFVAGASALAPLLDTVVAARDLPAVVVVTLIGTCTSAALLLQAGGPASDRTRGGETAALCLLSASGAMLLAATDDLLVAFIAAELLCVPLSALARRGRVVRGDRTALGWYGYGGVVAAIFAYGAALTYVNTGSTAIAALGGPSASTTTAGTALLLVAAAAVAAILPPRVWSAPSVTAPPFVSAFVAVIPRLAGFALLLRISAALPVEVATVDWRASIALLAAASLVAGELGALRQSSLRRLLAYAAVAQGGYLAVAAASGTAATGALLFALAVTASLMLGLWAALSRLDATDPSVADLGGVLRRRPFFALALIALLLGLAGLPPTGGFAARLAIYDAAMRAQLAWLVILAAGASVVAAATCLRVIFACLGEGEGVSVRSGTTSAVVVTTAALAVLALGVLPGPVLDAFREMRF